MTKELKLGELFYIKKGLESQTWKGHSQKQACHTHMLTPQMLTPSTVKNETEAQQRPAPSNYLGEGPSRCYLLGRNLLHVMH